MTRVLYIVIGLLLIGIVGALSFDFFAKQQSGVPAQPLQTGLSEQVLATIHSGDIPTGDQSTNPLIYTNKEFGFQLTLPQGWENYRTFLYNNADMTSGVSIVFALPTTEKNRPGVINPNDENRFVLGYTGQYSYISGYADMVSIDIYTNESYDRIMNTSDPIYSKEMLKNKIIGKNNKFFFMMSGPNDRPIDIAEKRKLRQQQGKEDYFNQIKRSIVVL